MPSSNSSTCTAFSRAVVRTMTAVAVTPPSRAPGNGEEDLAASACAGTLLGDGKVYIFEAGEMPDGAEIAALCRY